MTADKVNALADAMAQLLDDMGKDGNSVCQYAKAKARIAYEPFNDDPDSAMDWMTVEEAKRIIMKCDEG